MLCASAFLMFGCEPTPDEDDPPYQEAMYYEKVEDDKIRCRLCFRECTIEKDNRGFCRNRENIRGNLYNLVYGRPSAVNVDKVEKLPLYHYRPGLDRLNIGTASCNLRCKYCHNWHLSQSSIDEVEIYDELSPEEIVEKASERKVPSISFTYNEPTAFYEYAYDIARRAREEGIEVLLNSNGTMQPESMRNLLKHIDAVNIDLKGFSEEFYKEVTQGKLAPVLDNLKLIREEGVWLELVNLVVPGLNDDAETIGEMCRWIREHLGKEVPLHFSRFFPSHKLTELSPTPVETLEKAHSTAKEEGLMFVTIGNLPGHKHNSTFCPECEEVLVERTHFTVHEVNVENNKCRFCGTSMPGVWD